MAIGTPSRLGPIVLAALALALAGAFPPQAVAKPKNVTVLGFSLRGAQASLVEPGSTLTSRGCRPRALFAFVALGKVRRGTQLTWTWRHGGRMVMRYQEPWSHGAKRRVERLALTNPRGLPRGSYQLAVRIPGKGTAVGRIDLACGR